ncbi:MAG: hypothetical protein EBU46_10720 [Nitrosomonadaceae bacterium]|nr:hypothetical protein [Nitrosomonadaceae bacterium]
MQPCLYYARRFSGLILGIYSLFTVGFPSVSAQTNPPLVEVDPSVYVSRWNNSVTLSYPTSLAWWQCCAPPNDYGVTTNISTSWDGTNLVVTGTSIWPSGGTNADGSAAFSTRASAMTYKLNPYENVWTLIYQDIDGIWHTNFPADPGSYLGMRDERRNQTGHSITNQLAGMPDDDNNPTTVDVTTVTTNASTLTLYTGVAADSTYPHPFRLTAHVWDTTGEEIEYSPEYITVLGQTLDTNSAIVIVRADNVRETVTPVVAGSPNDTRSTVTPEKLKVRFYAQAGKLTQGYDPRPGTNDDHWTSLAVGGTNQIAELRIPADWATNRVELKVTGPISVSQTNSFSTQVTPLTIISTGNEGTATVEAQFINGTNKTTLAQLKIRIMPVKVVMVDIFRVEDSSSTNTTLGTTPDNTSIISTLNQIYQQACIVFQDVSLETEGQSYQVNYDTNTANGLFDIGDPDPAASEKSALSHLWAASQAQFHLVILADSSALYDSDGTLGIPESINHARGAHDGDRAAYGFMQRTGGMIGEIFAHEIGHLYGFQHDNPPWPDTEEHVMRDGEPTLIGEAWQEYWPGGWFRAEDWLMINSSPKN